MNSLFIKGEGYYIQFRILFSINLTDNAELNYKIIATIFS